MSIKEIPGYAVVCDYPGCAAETSDLGDFAFWTQAEHAVAEWVESDGLEVDQKHYCHEHTVWDEAEDATAPMPEGYVGGLLLMERHLAARIGTVTRAALVEHNRRCNAADARARGEGREH